MKNEQYKLVGSLFGAVLMAAVCMPHAFAKTKDLKPAKSQYSFVAKNRDLRRLHSTIYPEKRAKGNNSFTALISDPTNHSVCFSENKTAFHIGDGRGLSLSFPSGMYPFQIFKSVVKSKGRLENSCRTLAKKHRPLYTGAMAFYNYDKEMELTSFGRSAETKMIDAMLLEKARNGVLTSHTIKFEERPRISYWIGNRESWFVGGEPTVELDFSNVDLDELKINGKKDTDRVIVLPVSSMQKIDGVKRLVGIEHRIYMKHKDGREFEGYIHQLLDNEHTAFMKVTCDIPDELFAAASRGTVAKFDIKATNSDENYEVKLAEIVFGLKQ
jgi:hypothetical protein